MIIPVINISKLMTFCSIINDVKHIIHSTFYVKRNNSVTISVKTTVIISIYYSIITSTIIDSQIWHPQRNTVENRTIIIIIIPINNAPQKSRIIFLNSLKWNCRVNRCQIHKYQCRSQKHLAVRKKLNKLDTTKPLNINSIAHANIALNEAGEIWAAENYEKDPQAAPPSRKPNTKKRRQRRKSKTIWWPL